MNLLELAQKRCSIRKYASSPVEDEKLAYILEAGRMAPSAVNFQPWYFVIIRCGNRHGTYQLSSR